MGVLERIFVCSGIQVRGMDALLAKRTWSSACREPIRKPNGCHERCTDALKGYCRRKGKLPLSIAYDASVARPDWVGLGPTVIYSAIASSARNRKAHAGT